MTKMSAWIEQKPSEFAQPSPGPAEEIDVTAETYDEGTEKLRASVPEGWRMLNIGVDR